MIRLHTDNKREKIATLLSASGFLKLLEVAKARLPWLTALAYHRVLDIAPSGYPFDMEVVSASCQAFDWQMNFVSKNFDVITFAALKNCLEGNIPHPKQPLIITFEDGYADNYFYAFPILKKYRLPATLLLYFG